jgi:hypothetical protein
MNYEQRVRALELEGMTTSDAQAVIDAELLRDPVPDSLASLVLDLVERLDRSYPSDVKTALIECKSRAADFVRPASERFLYTKLAKLLRSAGK